MGDPVRVCLVDDHPVTLWGLRSALEAGGLVVVGATTGTEGLDPATFDVLMLDLFLHSDLPCLPTITDWAGRTRVVVMSASHQPEDRAMSVTAGASAFVHKGSTAQQYVEAIRAVAPGPVAGLVAAPEPNGGVKGQKLSPRERLVLGGIARGRTHDQIARELGISRHTVDTYVKRVRSKMNIGNKAELTRAFLEMPA